MLTQLSPKTRPVHPKSFAQAKELQSLLMDAARDPECSGQALAQVARAWSDLEERKRVIKMKPAPKPIDVSQRKPRRRASVAAPAIVDAPSQSPELPSSDVPLA